MDISNLTLYIKIGEIIGSKILYAREVFSLLKLVFLLEREKNLLAFQLFIYPANLNYLQKNSDDFGQQVSENKTARMIFKRPNILRYNKITLVSRNKPHVIRNGLEMSGIVNAVTN